MKTTLSLILGFFIYCPILFSQESTTQTIKTEISLNYDENTPDSTKEKLSIISEELQVPGNMFLLLMEGVSWDKPAHIDQIEFMGEFRELLKISFARFSEQHPEYLSEAVELYLENFTLAELAQLRDFYATDLGKKATEVNKTLNSHLIKFKKEFKEIQEEVYVEEFGKGKKKRKKSKKK